MNPSHGLSWEKSGEQEGVFATLFILTGNLVKTNETVSSYFKAYSIGSGSELTDCNDLHSIPSVRLSNCKNNAFQFQIWFLRLELAVFIKHNLQLVQRMGH